MQPALKLNFIQRQEVGRISEGDKQRYAPFKKRQYMVFTDQFFVDQIDGQATQINSVNIEKRQAVF
jgi:hypothetical protein